MSDKQQQAEKGKTLALPGKPLSLELPEKWLDGVGGPVLITSIDQTSAPGRIMIAECIDGECDESGAWINRTMEVAHVLLHPVKYTEPESGEVISFIRSVLVLADGKRVQFGSGGVIKSLQTLAYINGNPPWSPPLMVELQRIPTSGGRSRYRLRKVD